MSDSKPGVDVDLSWGWWFLALAGYLCYHQGTIPGWAAILCAAPAGLGLLLAGILLGGVAVACVGAAVIFPIVWVFDKLGAQKGVKQ